MLYPPVKGGCSMKKEKGMSTTGVVIILILIIIAAIIGAKYFGKPVSGVITGVAGQAKGDIDKANQAKDAMNKATQASEDAVKKLNKAIDDAK